MAGAFFVFGRFFQHFPIKAWCRHSCPDAAAENITWCVNIVNFDHNIETCIGPSGVNTSCEAQLVGLENFLSLPSVQLHCPPPALSDLFPSFLCRTAHLLEVWAAWASPTWTGTSRTPTSPALWTQAPATRSHTISSMFSVSPPAQQMWCTLL